MPMFSARNWVNFFSLFAAISCPRIRGEAEDRLSIPDYNDKSVDFPLPDCPTTATVSPCCTSRFKFFRTSIRPWEACGKELSSPFISRIIKLCLVKLSEYFLKITLSVYKNLFMKSNYASQFLVSFCIISVESLFAQ